jgi:ribonucleoside-diphosphate reductase alpha chain
MVAQLSEDFKRRAPSSGHIIHIENIQDKVELVLMRAGEHQAAREYVLYREEHRKLREQNQAPYDPSVPRVMLADGRKIPLDMEKLNQVVTEAILMLQPDYY